MSEITSESRFENESLGKVSDFSQRRRTCSHIIGEGAKQYFNDYRRLHFSRQP